MDRPLIRAASLAVATCAWALGLAACGDDEDDTATTDGSTASTTESTTSSTTEASTTSAPTTEAPTTAPPTSAADCVGTAEGATAESSATGDVDGDGSGDTLEVLHDGAGTWYLQMTLGSGGSSYTELPTAGGAGGKEMIGAADIDEDGKEEIFVQTGSGASAAVIGVFTVEGGCDIAAVTLDGAPAEFAVGASVGNTSGLQCSNVPEAGSIIAFSGTSTDGETYTVSHSELELAGTVLTEVDSGSGTAGYGDELYTAASTFHCDDVTYGA
jgi:hypothetical protein